MRTEEERKLAFIVGLTKLTRETRIVISGCGCCGSPSIDDMKPEQLADERSGYGEGYAGEISWISPSDPYDWEHYAASIVR